MSLIDLLQTKGYAVADSGDLHPFLCSLVAACHSVAAPDPSIDDGAYSS